MVHAPGFLHKALILLFAGALVGSFACGGSALEGTAPNADTPDGSDTSDGDVEVDGLGDVADTADTAVADTAGDTAADGDTAEDAEVDAGPSQWAPVSLGDEGVVSDVVIVSDALGFAASGTRVLRWDGRLWAAYGAPFGGGGEVFGVYADADVVVAVGEGGHVARRPTTGGTWEPIAGAPAVTLRAAAGRGESDLFVAGDDGTVAHWDGAAWTPKFSSTTIDLQALWIRPGTSGDDGVFAVGSGGQLVAQVGEVWKASLIARGTVVLKDVIGLDDGTLIAVGNEHTVTIKRPTALGWQLQVTNDERQRDLAALAAEGGVVRSFGASGAVLTLAAGSWNVDTGAAIAAGVKDFEVADAAPTGPTVALTGAGGGILFDGTRWSSVATLPDATLTAFAELGGELWAAGTRGFLARRGPSGWSVVPTGTDADLYGLAAAPGDTLVAVGARGTILTVDGQGAVTQIAAPVPIDLTAVSASPLGVLACGRGGTLLAVGATATLVPSGTTADLKAIALGGDGRVWVAGAFGTLVRMAAALGEPEPIASGVGGSLAGLASAPEGVFAVGDNGVVLRADGAAVTFEHEEPGKFLYAVASAADGRAVAAGAGGFVLVRAGSTWVPELVTERGATFQAAYLGAGGEALIGGVFRVMHVESRLEEAP